jgi:hypothetical protein
MEGQDRLAQIDGRDASSMGLSDRALLAAATHVAARSRAFLFELEGFEQEIESLRDDRAMCLLNALREATAAVRAGGALNRVERRASELVKGLQEPVTDT